MPPDVAMDQAARPRSELTPIGGLILILVATGVMTRFRQTRVG